MDIRHCKCCGLDKPIGEFYKSKPECKKCRAKIDAERYGAIKSGRLIGTPRTTAMPVVPMKDIVTSRNNIGDASELLFATVAVIKGWNVLWPFSNNLPYDCAIEVPGINKLLKVQIKTVNNLRNTRALLASPRLLLKGIHHGRNSSGRTHYKSDDFDMLAAVSPTRTWLIPWSEICCRRQVTLTADYDKYIIHEQNT